MKARAIIAEKVAPRPGARIVLARGGSDAHLRLATLLALQAAPDIDARREATAPDTPWPARADALWRALSAKGAAPVALVDPDAAWAEVPSGGAAFDDVTSARERARFFASLLDLGAEFGWLFIRTSPRAEVTEAMDARGIATDADGGDASDLPELAPALQPIARWLSTRRGVDFRHLRRLIGDADDPQDALISMFEDVIGPATRRAARHLALLREVHPVNGAAGPFATSGDGPLTLPAEALATLVEAGALCSWRNPAGTLFAMPSVLRDRLARRQAAVEPDETSQLRLAIASILADSCGAPVLEAHRQAVLAGDRELAFRTAAFFATDLRLIARELSQKAKQTGRVDHFREAADIYARIVDHYDREDAYAWQYLAFNLERTRSGPDDHLDARIRKAFRTSCELADRTSYNPLYHGRRLAFEARLGRDIDAELRQHLSRTVRLYGRDHARWLVLPVRPRLSRSGWEALVNDHPWIRSLRKLPPPPPVPPEA